MPLPYIQGNEVPSAVVDIEPRIEAIAAGIVSTVVNIEETGHTWFAELVDGTKDYHTGHRNLHLDYFAYHN